MKTALWRALRGDTAQSSLRESSSSLSSSSSSSSASWTDEDDDSNEDEDAKSILPHDAHPRARQMFEAIQRLDLEGAIDVIEEDELDVCTQNGVAPPRGMRKVEQRSELINFEDAYGMTPLLLACRIGAGRVVMGLLLRGADANKENKLGVTPLIACAKYGNVNAANALLKKGVGYDVAQVLRVNKRGETAFDHILASAKSKLEPVFDAAAALEEDGNKTLLKSKRIGKDQSIRKRQVAVLVSKLVGGIRNAHNTGTARSKQVLSRDDAARVIQRRVRKILAKRRLREAMWRVAALRKRERMIEACAVKIQRSFRQGRARRAAHEQIKLHRAAVQIQKIFRGRVERRARALVLAAQREGQDIAAMWQRHRGWMARYYLCAVDVAWEHKVERAVGVIARTVRAWLAKRRVAGLRRRRDAAIVLQRHGRGHLERTPRRQRERRFRKRSRDAREEIRAALASAKDILPILQSKRQFVAARSICRALKPTAVEAVARRTLCRKVAAAVRLQAFVRGVLGRRLAYMLFARHEARLEALRGCLVVSGLHPVAGAKRKKDLCGKCLKCECERYGEADLGSGMSRDICTHCGHHESNHERLDHGGPHGAVENRRELQDVFQFQVGPAGRNDGSIFKQRKLKREAERELRKAVRARVERQWARASAQRRDHSVYSAQHLLELQQKSNLRDEDAREDVEGKLDCSRLGVSQTLLPGLAKVQKMQRSLRDQLEEQRLRLAQIEHLARHSPPPRPLQSLKAREKVLFDIHGMEHRRKEKAKRLKSIRRGCEVSKKGLPPLARKTKSSKRSVNSMCPAAVASIQRGVVSDPFAAECAAASSKRKKENVVASKRSDAVECACQTDGGVEVQVFTAIARLEARIVRRQLSEVVHAKASDARAQEEAAAGPQHSKLNREGARTQCELASISGRVFPLRCTPVIVGRSSPSDILVGADDDDETEKSRPRLVSKRHLILHLDSLGAELVDLSTNGTYINGHRVARSEPRRLAHGDVLALGALDGPRFTFYVKNRSTSATDGVRTSKNLLDRRGGNPLPLQAKKQGSKKSKSKQKEISGTSCGLQLQLHVPRP